MRQITLHLEESKNFKRIREGYERHEERFEETYDVVEELGNGSLYLKLQDKMTEPILSRYHRWIPENKKAQCIDSLR